MKQEMTYQERELLKSFDFGNQEKQVLIMIAHWMRQSEQIPFSLYAAHWAAADLSAPRNTSKLQEAWPLPGARMIADGFSEWGSY